MTYLGISRGCAPIRTPEQIAALDNISPGYNVLGWVSSYLCRECNQTSVFPDVPHREGCKTGKTLTAMWKADGSEAGR